MLLILPRFLSWSALFLWFGTTHFFRLTIALLFFSKDLQVLVSLIPVTDHPASSNIDQKSTNRLVDDQIHDIIAHDCMNPIRIRNINETSSIS